MVNYLPSDSQGSFDVAISKNYTRLASLYAFFNRNPASDNAGKAKRVNSHCFPGACYVETLRYHLALGSRRIPDNDVMGTKEAWIRLQNTLGLANSLAHSTSVDETSFETNCFGVGVNCEKLDMVSSSGENCSTGQTLFLKVKGMGSTGGAAGDVPQQCLIAAHFDGVVAIQDTVVDFFT